MDKIIIWVDAFLARQCKIIFGVIESRTERILFIITRYVLVCVLPLTTPMYHYSEYPGFTKVLFFAFVWIGAFMLYCIILDLYITFKKIKHRIKNHENVDFTKKSEQEILDYAKKIFKPGDKITNALSVYIDHNHESIVPTHDNFYWFDYYGRNGTSRALCADGAGILYMNGIWAKKIKHRKNGRQKS